MQTPDNILPEEEGLKNLPRTNAFQVPEGYFETLPEKIQARLHEPDTTWHLPKGEGFEVPEGYFNTLAQNITARISGKEENALSGLPRTTGFVVPENYFNELSGQVMNKTQAGQKKGQILRVTWVRFAAAAAIVILVTGLVLKFTGSGPITDNTDTVALNEVSEEEIFGYLESSDANVSLELVAEVYDNENTQPEKTEKTGDISIDSNAQLEEYILENVDEQLILEEL